AVRWPAGGRSLAAAMEGHEGAGRIAGAVVLVARNGATVHPRSYGVSDRPSARPMRNDDIFRIYSMTKPVVSVALLMLYEEGHFQLSDPLERYIPDRKSTRLNSSHVKISYAVFCLKKKKNTHENRASQ